jgi:hypothetical protein
MMAARIVLGSSLSSLARSSLWLPTFLAEGHLSLVDIPMGHSAFLARAHTSSSGSSGANLGMSPIRGRRPRAPPSSMRVLVHEPEEAEVLDIRTPIEEEEA